MREEMTMMFFVFVCVVVNAEVVLARMSPCKD